MTLDEESELDNPNEEPVFEDEYEYLGRIPQYQKTRPDDSHVIAYGPDYGRSSFMTMFSCGDLFDLIGMVFIAGLLLCMVGVLGGAALAMIVTLTATAFGSTFDPITTHPDSFWLFALASLGLIWLVARLTDK